ncbi:MAG: S49 family peptidase [Desulfobulbaceae bacterium]|nr:S49 family peptidase [Desulfobulbaceae bacterium]
MKRIILLVSGIILLFTNNSYSQKSFTTYYEMRDFMQSSSGAFKFGLYGFDNPAILNYNQSSLDMLGIISSQENIIGFKRWGLFTGLGGTGFGVMSRFYDGKPAYDYRISQSFGSRTFGMGISYGWSNSHGLKYGFGDMMQVGMLIRPNGNLSLAFNHAFSLMNSNAETVAEIAIRPFTDYPMTFFVDASLFDDKNLSDLNYSGGLSWEFAPGVRANGRYFRDEIYSLGVDISFGRYGVGYNQVSNSSDGFAQSAVGLRMFGNDRTFTDDVLSDDMFVALDLSGSIKYQRNRWFDDSMTLIDLLYLIDESIKDEFIKGMVVNLTNFSANKSMTWEIRNKLLEFKNSGKTIVAYIDRASIDLYHLASVADKIIIDEMGYLSIKGYASGRSYYKRMFDNLGVGFEELRYFKYKSAFEDYTRTEMSEGEREQRQALIDSWYESTREEICSSRKISISDFDRIVDSKIGYFPSDAIAEKLADEMGRWMDMEKKISKDYRIAGVVPIGYRQYLEEPIDDQWGAPKKRIAIYYLTGVCDMDEGIKAREAAETIKWILESPYYSALILRVDSPGGDAMASDYISKLLSERKDKIKIVNVKNFRLDHSIWASFFSFEKDVKPVIVTQGMVAASGGYWLSMNADEIVASPFTVTGSIGVIGAWIYDKGLQDTLGIGYDMIKRGKYSDMGQSYTLPIIPIGLPLRNLTPDELDQRTIEIMALYDKFITLVTEGREISKDNVEVVAQGRIWTGVDAKKIGLVDKIGGLDDAIKVAKEKAGIKEGERYTIDEFPAPKMFDLIPFISNMVGINVEKTKQEINTLDFLLQNNGKPMPMLSIDYWDIIK